MGNHDTKVGDCVGKCPGQTLTQTNYSLQKHQMIIENYDLGNRDTNIGD